ncbi:MAG: SpoIVB peptidase S55 domain-containing protein, partial [bacterium]
MRLFVIVAVLFFLLAYPLFSQDTNSGSFGSDILTTGEIQPGMKGYGLTTLKGNEIVRYPVEIISVMGNRGTYPHFRSILIRIDDDEFPDNWVGFNSDMAGSPIYVNGRLIGAVSTFYDWSMQEIAQVRPIEEMHMISDRQRNHNENDQAFQRKTLLDNNDAEPKNLQVDKSGLDNSANQQSNSIRPLRPGDAVAAIWSIGDYTQYEMGNITYISDNNEFYAFGKSVFNRAGTINAPLVRADVLNTMEGIDRNFQVANPEL